METEGQWTEVVKKGGKSQGKGKKETAKPDLPLEQQRVCARVCLVLPLTNTKVILSPQKRRIQ